MEGYLEGALHGGGIMKLGLDRYLTVCHHLHVLKRLPETLLSDVGKFGALSHGVKSVANSSSANVKSPIAPGSLWRAPLLDQPQNSLYKISQILDISKRTRIIFVFVYKISRTPSKHFRVLKCFDRAVLFPFSGAIVIGTRNLDTS